MDNWRVEFDQRSWAHDIESYYRWKSLRNVCYSQNLKDKCQQHMDRIKAQYPQHKQAFEE